MTTARVSQAELARRLGISQPTISYLVRNGATGSKYLRVIARELGVTEAYLEGRSYDPKGDILTAPNMQRMADYLDLVPIAALDQDACLGGDFIDDNLNIKVNHFPRSWVESITLSPPTFLTTTRGVGDSMDPTIRNQDMLIIDRSRQTIDEVDAIWAITVKNIGMIKRLRLRGGKLIIKSDNDIVKDEVVNVGDVKVIGRVIFIGRRT